MLCPRPKAKPAELKFTWWGARNMHTTLVFLYWPFAFWTGLGICQNPIHILRLSTILQYPLRNSVTIYRTVSFFSTIPAETVTAATIHIIITTSNNKIYSIVTARSGTPLGLSIVFNV
jgi:hypothetical protein